MLNQEAMEVARNEDVFKTSLLRDVNINTIQGQFLRIVNGLSPLTKFDFQFVRKDHEFSDLNIESKLVPESLPPSNIHALIGKNGLGKTTLLNEMINSTVGKRKPPNAYFEAAYIGKVNENYFSTVISVSFSAFDPFNPISEQSNPLLGTCYYYIGLKKTDDAVNENSLENISDLQKNMLLQFITVVLMIQKEKHG